MNMKAALISLPILTSVLLAGCATSGPVLPQGGPTMGQIYKKKMTDSNSESVDQLRTKVNADVVAQQVAYTRTAANELQSNFKWLPNPTVVMFVYPHLAGLADQNPVPGYSTEFKLYQQDHIALPGERTV